jgi:hypothetical protein
MADENQEQQYDEGEQQQSAGGGGASTAAKAAAAAAATGFAAIAAKRALSHRGDSNGQSRDGGSSSRREDVGSMLSSALSGGWDAARDALLPAAEDAAGAAGEYLAQNGPEFVRDRIVPRFIDSFNEARGGS